MPLLRKQPFQRLHVSSDFKDDDEVFHCEVTNEIFKDYNEFCERIILCNSLIWSCSITGKSNMTYEDALQCEENAKRSLKEFPMELRMPILYLASKTHRSSFNEMVEDVYQFARDRYFVGEMVEASFTEDSWYDCHVLQVIAPTDQQIKAYLKEHTSLQDQQYHPPSKLFRYEVEQLDCGDSDVSQLMIVEATQVRRQKQLYSKERNKIFLRQLCEQNESGIWVVKESFLQKYGISKVRFNAIFAGPPPDFALRTKKTVKHKQESMDKFLTSYVAKPKSSEKPDPLKKVNAASGGGGLDIKKFRKPRANGKFRDDLKAKALEEKAKRKEEREQKIERKKEEKQKLAALAAYVRLWDKPREDLECENLVPLPPAVPVQINVPNEKFGDLAMILEFLEFFNEELEVSAHFPGGVTLDLLEKAFLAAEVSGPWSDLLQMLLACIFRYQADEEDEIHAQPTEIIHYIDTYEGAPSMAKAVKLATVASTWSQLHHGNKLSELALDHLTLSEILRQHLLSSGGRIGEAASKWRYSQRGGYTNLDDPALLMRINEAHILRVLGHRSVAEFNLDDKLKVITCLINQLLTFASIRDVIDERHEKLQQARKELKSFLIAEQKKERLEEKEKTREKEKEKDEDEEKTPNKIITRGNREEDKKKEYENKLSELRQASRDEKMMVYLGSDRAHRRYWRFMSIPGFFVENDERWPGTCLPEGTPYQPELQDKDALYAYLRNKFEDEFSDKENSFKKLKKSPKKVSFSEKNGLKSPRKDATTRRQELLDIRKKLMACTGDKECPVHCKRTEPKWSFYASQGDIDILVNALTKRGYRERELRNNIEREKTSLLSVIQECPTHKLNPEVFTDAKNKEQTNNKMPTKKSKHDYPPDTSIDSVMELTLRDYILEFEDKIKGGCLGTLKVNDREAWRNAIMAGTYNKQCDRLVYGMNETEVDVALNSILDKVKNEAKQSRPNTPDSEVGSINTKTYTDSEKYLGPPADDEIHPDPRQQAAIKQMACAILQLLHAIEVKYLQKPLGPSDKDKKWSGEEVRDRWEQSLMASTSWSQLFLHLSTLDNSVTWTRSALNAHCRICRRRRDAELMLLCDGCNKGHHLYCLKPKLTAVPEGDWFCRRCKPPSKSREKVKKRKKFEDESDEETLLTKETRHNRARRIPESDEEFDSDEEPYETDDDFNSNPMSVCISCGSGGKLIKCDTCPDYYHVECADPPLARAPRGRWACATCKERRRNNGKIDSNTSDDAEPRQTRRAAKRALQIEQEEEDKGTFKGSMGKLQELLAEIRQHRDSWPFLSPVTKDEVPDYHEIITNPMDFGTIKMKLNNGAYENIDQFFSDCQLVFNNCQAYNEEHSVVYNYVYRAGTRLLKFFEKRCRELGLNYTEDIFAPSDAKKRRLEENGMEVSDDEDTEAQKRR